MSKKKRICIVLLVLAAVLLLFWGKRMKERYDNQKKYEEMMTEGAAEITETTAAETVSEAAETESAVPEDPDADRVIDFAALKKRNPDVVAWVMIPGTKINYPVLWAKGDNEFYLRRDIDRKEGSYEGIYLDGADLEDFSKRQNLIYGHHMKNGTMFTAICDFKDETFFREHRKVYLYTPEHTYILRTAACLCTDAGAERRRVNFSDAADFADYTDRMTEGCAFRDLPEEGIDRLFAFVTCSYEFKNARTILYCYETDRTGAPVKTGLE